VRLGLQPRWGLHEAVERTMRWYRRQGAGEGGDARTLCLADWADFEAVAA
jgi:CDP-glucose 4,6-dehydratase